MTYEEIRFAWNAQAEDGKQWNSLTEAEKIEWAFRLGAEKERGPTPIFSQDAQQTLQHLQRKGFNVVGYALEHHNSWTDNLRCTVDSKGLVRWIPSADQEVAAERDARQKAQAEVAELKERIARAGVEHRRALHEALQQEREACAQVCDEVGDKMGDSVGAYDCAAAIRARTTTKPRTAGAFFIEKKHAHTSHTTANPAPAAASGRAHVGRAVAGPRQRRAPDYRPGCRAHWPHTPNHRNHGAPGRFSAAMQRWALAAGRRTGVGKRQGPPATTAIKLTRRQPLGNV